MNTYYNSNALYDYLKANPNPTFTFTVGNMWQLVYGDGTCEAKVLVLVVGKSKNDFDSPLDSSERNALLQLKHLSKKCKIPLFYVRFRTDEEIENIRTINKNGELVDVKITTLTKRLQAEGLPVSNSATRKYLNDKNSSAYHKWQRQCLGRDLTVSDIDLWKLDAAGNPMYFYELKRSYYALDRWKPFPADYRNFRLLSNLANRANIGFRILYNVRQKMPFKDDISTLKIFDIDFLKDNPITDKGIIRLENFLLE